MRIEAQPATRADIAAFLGQQSPVTLRAWVWKDGNEVKAMAGYYMHNGWAVMVSEIHGSAPKATIWREARKMMDRVKVPALCVAQAGSGRFLERLGWVHEGHGEDGEVYSWQPS